MEKFEIKFRGYDTVQVNNFIDETIVKYEELLNKYKNSNDEIISLKKELEHYKSIESTLRRAIFSAEDKCDEMKNIAREESNTIINDAKINANRIVNEALLEARRAEDDMIRMRRNINTLKRRLKMVIESGLSIVDEIEEIDLKSDDRDGVF